MKQQNQIQHIHLLRPDAFTNKAPHKLVAKNLNMEQENKRKTFIGKKPEKESNMMPKEYKAALTKDAKSGNNRGGSLLLEW